MEIASTIENAEQLFHDILRQLEIDKENQSYGVDSRTTGDARDRFKIWVGGVRGEDQSTSMLSSEPRSPSAIELFREVSNLLRALNGALKDLLEIISGRQANRSIVPFQYDDDSNVEVTDPARSSRSEAQVLIVFVNERITSLFRVSTLFKKTKAQEPFPEYPEFVGTTLLEEKDLKGLEAHYPKLSKPEFSWLRDRLACANTQRRHFVEYCLERHEQALAEKIIGGDGTGMPLYGNQIDIRPKMPQNQASALVQTVSGAQGRHMMSEYSSTVLSAEDPDMNLGLPQQGYGSTRENEEKSHTPLVSGDTDSEFAALPRLREFHDGSQVSECPFCGTSIKPMNTIQWQRHAYEDLRLYVCTDGKDCCDNELFGDRTSWFNHESQHHRCQWVCGFCPKGPFRAASQLRDHAIADHPNAVPVFGALIAAGRRSLQHIPVSDCPFCDEWEQSLLSDFPHNSKTIDDHVMVEVKHFREHVARHLQHIALLSIPRNIQEHGMRDNSKVPAPQGGSSSIGTEMEHTKSTTEYASKPDSVSPGDPFRKSMDNRDILEASASRRSSRASPEAIFENMNVSPADATHSPIINRPSSNTKQWKEFSLKDGLQFPPQATSTKAIEQRVSYQRSERSSGIDPLSVLAVLANAISLFDFSVKIHSLISRWREAPEYLRKLEDTIRNMESVLKIVGRTLKTMSATSLDPGDEKIFFTIVRNYTELVDELDEILRQSDRTGTSLDRLRRPLAKMMKERDIDNKISKIHLDLSQLTLVHTSLIWRELVEFKAAVDEFNRLLPNMAPPVYSGPPEDFTTPTTPAMPMGESSSESLFDLLIQDAPVDTNEERRPSLPDGIYNLEKRKLEEQVQELRENRMFFKAAQVQKEIVEMVESQVDVQLDPDICDPREQQADLLLDCYAPARHHEAAKILFDVLRRLKERAQTEVSLKRQGRLLSKLAKVFRDEDGLGILHDPGKSKLFFRSSLNSLSRMNPFPAEEFLAVGAAMVGFHEANSEFDQAKELENRIPRLMEQYCPGVQFKWSDYKNDSERSVLRWCRQQGFRANELSFRFDVVQPSINSNTSPLHLAIQEGDKDLVEKMLVEVEAINLRDNNGMTPLMLAAQARCGDIVELLLKYNASTDLLTLDGRTCLHLCLEGDAQKGVQVTALLLDSNPGLKESKDGKGRTALHLAVSNGHQKLCKILLERQADPNTREERGKTALLMAIESHAPDQGRIQTSLARVSTSSSRRSSHSSQGQPIKSNPRPNPKPSIIQLLIDNGADPTIADYTDNLPLHSACGQNDIETVKLLLQNRARYEEDFANQRGPRGTTPVIVAVQKHDPAIIRELIKYGASPSLPDSTGRSAMDYARSCGPRGMFLLPVLYKT